MNSEHKLVIGTRILSARFLGRKVPISVGWAVTKRCNARCTYCGKWNDPHDDTPSGEALSLCDQFIKAGTRIVSLTGGEPLVRDDIGVLIRLLKEGGIYVILASNGILVPEKLEIVRKVDRLTISFDGPKEIHDRFRGKGSFDHAVTAVKSAKSAGIPVVLATVLHSGNVGSIESLLNMARDFGCKLIVQPVVPNPESPVSHSEAIPNSEEMQRAINVLLKEKVRSRNQLIENSLPVLRHIREWPRGGSITCESRLVSCRVEPDGHVHNCGRIKNTLNKTDYRKNGFLNAFLALPRLRCSTCWCSSRYEINMLTSLNPLVLINMFLRF